MALRHARSKAFSLGQTLGATLAAAAFTLAGPPMAFLCGAALAGLLSALRR